MPVASLLSEADYYDDLLDDDDCDDALEIDDCDDALDDDYDDYGLDEPSRSARDVAAPVRQSWMAEDSIIFPVSILMVGIVALFTVSVSAILLHHPVAPVAPAVEAAEWSNFATVIGVVASVVTIAQACIKMVKRLIR